MPKTVEPRPSTSRPYKTIKIGAKAVSDRRDVISGMPKCGAGINILIDLDGIPQQTSGT